jgi:uncharacterized repeat protein (TIGR01451 family)
VTLVSHTPASPNQGGNGPSPGLFYPVAAVSASGSHVAFGSAATDLVAGEDSNATSDVFLYSTADGSIRLVSHPPGQAGHTASGGSNLQRSDALSADGSRLLFTSNALDLQDEPTAFRGEQLFLWSAESDRSLLVMRSYGAPADTGVLSAGGDWVAFATPASNVVPNDLNAHTDVFLFGPTRPGADLAVGAVAPASVTPPATVSATFVVVNLGQEAARGVALSLTSPLAWGAPATTGACSAWPCAIPTLVPGQFITVTVSFAVPSSYVAADPASIRLTARSATPDASPGNDTAEALVAIQPRADLELKLTGPASATPPHRLEYTLTVTNRGPSDAVTVQLDDAIPAGSTLVSIDGACARSFPCSLGSLAPGESRVASATFALPEGYSGPDPIHNAASVSSDSSDPNAANNVASLDTLLDTATAALGYYTVAPCRLVDTRLPAGPTAGAPLPGGEERWLMSTGMCGIPATARAVVVNATVTSPDAAGNVRLWPAGKPVPTTSVVSYRTGQTRGASVIVGLNAFGALAVKATGSPHVHLILDVAGYFE